MEHIFEIALPLTNPVLKFLLLLLVMLFVPIFFSKIKIPPLLGLIIAGAFLGQNGTNLLERDSSIILSGTAGLLYIMFLAGLEMDLKEFRKNSQKSIVFGLFTFLIPMTLGVLSSIYILNFSVLTSVLLASMFASHTLIAYPMVSKLGVSKNRAVTVTIGGTLITDTLALLVLAVIVGMTKGKVDATFWIKLVISLLIFGFTVLFIFPLIARSFFKRFHDNVSQYIFVLFIVFLGAFLAELAGIEPIIGAFLSGISLNRLIPHTSPLMNRIEFVGNAIFIPFFLIGVGMLIDYKVFFKDFETIKVGTIMIIVATLSKYLAAYFTQKTYKFTLDERRVIFGLSNAQAAATLAAVLVGYNIEIGKTQTGEMIRLLNENVLNGTILMILVTCTIASFIAQKGAKNIALAENDLSKTKEETQNELLKRVSLQQERILIPVGNIQTTDELINLSILIKSAQNKKNLYALSIVTDRGNNE
jgi:Kef-type K+ transport system membrane component KefB